MLKGNYDSAHHDQWKQEHERTFELVLGVDLSKAVGVLHDVA